MLQDKDRIFTNIYGMHDRTLKGAQARGHWDGTAGIIAKGRDWIVGDAPTIADFACCGYLYYPEPFGFARAEWPNIDRWLSNIAALPGWKHPYDLMPGHPLPGR